MNGLPFFHSEQKSSSFPAQNTSHASHLCQKYPFPAQTLIADGHIVHIITFSCTNSLIKTHSKQKKLPFPAQILKSTHSKQD